MRHLSLPVATLGLVLTSSCVFGSTLTLERVVSSGVITHPIQVGAPQGDSERLFILDRQKGEIVIQNRADGSILPTPFFKLPATLFAEGVPTQNAFSFAFSPDFSQSGKLYVSFVDKSDDLQVVEVTVSETNPNLADPASLRQILKVPYTPVGPGTHFGADVDFGPDGYLYITTGDSDAAFGDVQSQNLDSLQGKVLRIDPTADAFPDDLDNNFTPAPGNPFSGDTTEITDAIWARGLRNPFQASFDPVTGAYFIADVGEDRFEEIDLGVSGADYGWPALEGIAPFMPDLVTGDPVLSDPLYVYQHGTGPFEGFSVTGGAVYRGSIAELGGLYFFSDYVTALIWSFEFDLLTGTISDLIQWSLISPDGLPTGVVSFGTDGGANLYIVGEGEGGGVFRIANASIEAVPLPATLPLFASGLGLMGWLAWRKKRMAVTPSAY